VTDSGVTGFWLLRHAIVEENARAILYGTMDVELCPASLIDQRPMYASLARRLPRPAKWFVTPLSRTRRTAEAIFAAGYPDAPLTEQPELIEQNLGRWQGLAHAELPERLTLPVPPFWPHAALEHPPGGETMQHVIERVGRALERIAIDHVGRDIVLVMHGGSIRAAAAHALHLDAETMLQLSVQNLSLTRLERHPTAWRVVCVNELPGY